MCLISVLEHSMRARLLPASRNKYRLARLGKAPLVRVTGKSSRESQDDVRIQVVIVTNGWTVVRAQIRMKSAVLPKSSAVLSSRFFVSSAVS
jgi:hypothetical protein